MRSVEIPENRAVLRRLRMVLFLFVVALIVSGITAFPLRQELNWLCSALDLDAARRLRALTGLEQWLLTVRDGLLQSYEHYPWLAYGTDWLAFAHIAIAVFFVGVFVDPVRNIWVLKAGMIACALVIPLALICGPLRGIPFGWRLIDCSFGVFGIAPLWYCHKVARLLESNARNQ